MKIVLQILSWIGLVLTILPAMLVFTQQIDMSLHKWLMLAGLVLWFGGAAGGRRFQETEG